MRWLIVCLVFTNALVGAAQDVIDLGRTSCRQFLTMDREQAAVVMGWLQGYYLDEHAPPIVDLDKVKTDIPKLMERCTSRPDEDVMTAAEMLFTK
jgi:HdeA/HdeB family protein